MSGFFKRIFGHPPEPNAPFVPDDSELEERLKQASQQHRKATEQIIAQSNRQVRDSELVKEVIEGVLKRVEGRAQGHSSHGHIG